MHLPSTVTHLARACFAAVLILTYTAPGHAQSAIPKDRPRARPPSEITGRADWEKGEALLKRITVPPAPVLSAEKDDTKGQVFYRKKPLTASPPSAFLTAHAPTPFQSPA